MSDDVNEQTETDRSGWKEESQAAQRKSKTGIDRQKDGYMKSKLTHRQTNKQID